MVKTNFLKPSVFDHFARCSSPSIKEKQINRKTRIKIVLKSSHSCPP